MIIYLILIYITGAIIGYLTFKYVSKLQMSDRHIWSREDRMIGLLMSTLSWVMVLANLIIYMIEINDERPAKW